MEEKSNEIKLKKFLFFSSSEQYTLLVEITNRVFEVL